MTRRRLLLAALALGAAWYLTTGLSAEERRLVGTWSFRPGGGECQRWTIGPESVARIEGRAGPSIRWTGECRWTARAGVFVLDAEPSSIRRVLRPLLRALGVSVEETWQFTVEPLTGDRMVLVAADGTRQEWVRDPHD